MRDKLPDVLRNQRARKVFFSSQTNRNPFDRGTSSSRPKRRHRCGIQTSCNASETISAPNKRKRQVTKLLEAATNSRSKTKYELETDSGFRRSATETGAKEMTSKNILLIEPGYPNKYPPLGLMKLAAYHGPFGRNDRVKFVKGNDLEVMLEPWDRVYVTTLFSFEWKRTAEAIDFAIRAAGGQQEKVFVGGIAATLMHDQFIIEPRWAGVRFRQGTARQPACGGTTVVGRGVRIRL